jgi:hypothetical protein
LGDEIKEMSGACSMGERRGSYRVLVVKPKGKMTWKTGIDGMMIRLSSGSGGGGHGLE